MTPSPEFGTPDPRTDAALEAMLASQRVHDFGQRVGSALVIVSAVLVIAAPVLAVVAGVSWRLFRWASGI